MLVRLGRAVLTGVVAATFFGCGSDGERVESAPPPDAAYAAEIEEFRARRLTSLQSPKGWPSIAGFTWLQPGENSFGTDSTNAVVFPPGSGPAVGGVIRFDPEGPEFALEAAPGTEVLIKNKADTTGTLTASKSLAPDSSGDADKVFIGRVEFWVIKRGPGYAIRLRDPESPMRKNLKSVDNYEIDPAYRVRARLEPGSELSQIAIPNIMGYTDTAWTRGAMVFELFGEEHRLWPYLEGGKEDSALFVVFDDKTSGKETYGGGRHLDSRLEPDGSAIFDFNKAYNPPCAFTDYTTCPLPPNGNQMPVAVLAGEKYTGTLH